MGVCTAVHQIISRLHFHHPWTLVNATEWTSSIQKFPILRWHQDLGWSKTPVHVCRID